MTTRIKTISIKGKPKKYFTSFLDKKQHIYAFSNNEAADECVFFIAQYKSIYGEFPQINKPESNNVNAPKDILVLSKQSIFSIIENELEIETISINDLMEEIAISNMLILLIYNFEFKLNNNKQIDVSFSASSIIPDKVNIDLKKHLNTLL